MAIISTLTFSQFVREFEEHGRGDQFSREGLQLLYDYLDELDNYELDVIGLCCDYCESTADEAIDDNGLEIEDRDQLDEDELLEAVAKELERYTNVLGTTSDTVLYQMY